MTNPSWGLWYLSYSLMHCTLLGDCGTFLIVRMLSQLVVDVDVCARVVFRLACHLISYLLYKLYVRIVDDSLSLGTMFQSV
jgi:hypothetical protein